MSFSWIRSVCLASFAWLVFVLAVSCGGSSDTLANKDGISGTGGLAKPEIVSFELGHASYGSRNKSDFDLNTLAPVFRVELKEPVQGVSDILTLRIEDLTSGGVVDFDDIESNIKIIEQDGSQSFYIIVYKTSQSALSQKELVPGRTYRYVIRSRDGEALNFEGESVDEISGNITTKIITFTYPVTLSSEDSQINLKTTRLGGLKTLTPTFLVHSKGQFESFDASLSGQGYGILDKLKLVINGTELTQEHLGKISIDQASATAFRMSILDSAGLQWNSNYRLRLKAQNNLSVIDNNISTIINDEDLPQNLEIHTQPQ